MKKASIFILLLILFSTTIKAQHVFDKGTLGLNAGLGVGGVDGFFPSLEISGEYGVIPTGTVGVVSFGGRFAYKYSNLYDPFYYGYGFSNQTNHYNQFEIGVRSAWHLLIFNSDKWDVYTGLGAGIHLYKDYIYDYVYNYNSNKYILVDQSRNRSGLYMEGFAGDDA